MTPPEPLPEHTPHPQVFAAVARDYRNAGWDGVLPIPARKKSSPPRGFTGESGTWPTEIQLNTWVQRAPDANIALRMPHNVVGIDVDNYDNKPGAQTLNKLEQRCGPLPPTWISTSRSDGISGIRFYRLPEPVKLVGALPGIEIVQHHHRYAVVAPSIHPEGREYQWIDPDGVTGHQVAHVEDIPMLPDKWIEHLRADRHTTAERRQIATGQQEPSPAVDRALGAAMRRLTVGTRHDGALEGVTALTRLAHQNHPGADDALTTLERAFHTAVTADGSRRDDEAQAEWQRMTDAAEKLVTTTPSTRPPWNELNTHQPINLADLVTTPTATEPDKTAGEWPTPTPLPTRRQPAPWPTGVLPEWAENYARTVGLQVGVADEIPLTFALGAISTILNGTVTVQVADSWTEHTNLYLAALAPKGAGKSPAAKFMINPVFAIEADRREAAAEALDAYAYDAQVLARQRKALEDNLSNDPTTRQQALDLAAQERALERPPGGDMFCGDITPEKIVEMLADNGERIAVADTEGALLAIVAGRYSQNRSNNAQLVLKCWSGDDHRHARVGNAGSKQPPVHLRHPRMVIALAIQPKAWTDVLDNPGLVELGFADRFMVSYPPPRTGWTPDARRTINRDAKTAYETGLQTLENTTRENRYGLNLRLSDHAIDTFDAMRRTHQRRSSPLGDLAHAGEFLRKVEASTARLAGILHLAWGHTHHDQISGDTMTQATRMAAYWVDHHISAEGVPGIIRDAEKTLQWLANRDEATFTTRDTLRKGPRIYRDSDPVERGVGRKVSGVDRLTVALEVLLEHGWIRAVGEWDPSSTKRGVTRRFEVHPALLDGTDTPPTSGDMADNSPPTVTTDHGTELASKGEVWLTPRDMADNSPPTVTTDHGTEGVVSQVSHVPIGGFSPQNPLPPTPHTPTPTTSGDMADTPTNETPATPPNKHPQPLDPDLTNTIFDPTPDPPENP